MAEEKSDNQCFFCQAQAKNVCSFCNCVKYCSKACWKIHRPETMCFPFKVKYVPHVGRYMVATRDIKASGMISYLISYFFIKEQIRKYHNVSFWMLATDGAFLEINIRLLLPSPEF